MTNHPSAFAMLEAIRLAGNGRWHTAPNPAVGAVLVKDGVIVAQGWHKGCGQPHAEIECLRDAKEKGISSADCTLVVTLEPCNHEGKTPPCTEAIIDAGIKHVVIGLMDPTPKAGGGANRLREAGIKVEEGICADECRDLVVDFLTWQEERPFVILKMAGTLDGRIATRANHSRWVTGQKSRDRVHALRAATGLSGGAVMIGGNTMLADNPLLEARIKDTENLRQPLAVALISRLSGIGNLRLIKKRPAETIIFCTIATAASKMATSLRDIGVRVEGIGPWPPRFGLDLGAVLKKLFSLGCYYVLCEGGGKLGMSLLEANLVGEFHLHLAPKVLGDAEAIPLFSGRDPLTMQEAINMRITNVDMCGEDCHIILRPSLKADNVE